MGTREEAAARSLPQVQDELLRRRFLADILENRHNRAILDRLRIGDTTCLSG